MNSEYYSTDRDIGSLRSEVSKALDNVNTVFKTEDGTTSNAVQATLKLFKRFETERVHGAPFTLTISEVEVLDALVTYLTETEVTVNYQTLVNAEFDEYGMQSQIDDLLEEATSEVYDALISNFDENNVEWEFDESDIRQQIRDQINDELGWFV